MNINLLLEEGDLDARLKTIDHFHAYVATLLFQETRQWKISVVCDYDVIF